MKRLFQCEIRVINNNTLTDINHFLKAIYHSVKCRSYSVWQSPSGTMENITDWFLSLVMPVKSNQSYLNKCVWGFFPLLWSLVVWGETVSRGINYLIRIATAFCMWGLGVVLGRGGSIISGLYIGAWSWVLASLLFLKRLTLEIQLPLWSEEGETLSFRGSFQMMLLPAWVFLV